MKLLLFLSVMIMLMMISLTAFAQDEPEAEQTLGWPVIVVGGRLMLLAIITNIAWKNNGTPKPKWASSTLWATFLAAAVPLIANITGVELNWEELAAWVVPFLAYIFGEKMVDKARNNL